MSATQESRLDCDMCYRALTWPERTPAYGMRAVAKDRGWRRDKLGRDVCPDHPKLKGARR